MKIVKFIAQFVLISGIFTSVAAAQHNVVLSWQDNVNVSVTYNVYRGIQTGGPYTQLASNVGSLMYTDNSVNNGITYFYVVTAFDGTNESGYSNEVPAVIPIPTVDYWNDLATEAWEDKSLCVWSDISTLTWSDTNIWK